ncbi:MAG: immunity 53 family protein [Coprobacillaceae bacterium]
MNNLQWLQGWLLENCFIDSDHYYGITIETIDNPGWNIRIQLKDTILNSEKFEDIIIQRENEENWIQCKVENEEFNAFCGPKNLEEVISIFRKWVEHLSA